MDPVDNHGDSMIIGIRVILADKLCDSDYIVWETKEEAKS